MTRPALRVIATVWLLLLILGSLQPVRLGLAVGVHREAHWLAFAGAALLVVCLSRNWRHEILSTFVIFFVGLSLETLQHLIYGNPMEWRDVADDGVAVLAAFALYRLLEGRKATPDAGS
jgi:hypothetical protein